MSNKSKESTFANKESKYWIDKGYGIWIDILFSNNLHHVSVYNDKRETNVSFSIDNKGLKELASFLNNYLGDN